MLDSIIDMVQGGAFEQYGFTFINTYFKFLSMKIALYLREFSRSCVLSTDGLFYLM
jgi:hypothetical protein